MEVDEEAGGGGNRSFFDGGDMGVGGGARGNSEGEGEREFWGSD